MLKRERKARTSQNRHKRYKTDTNRTSRDEKYNV
jgi:hypothetical protein